MSEELKPLRIGTRIKLNREAFKYKAFNVQKYSGKQGTVVGGSRNGLSSRVLFDGMR